MSQQLEQPKGNQDFYLELRTRGYSDQEIQDYMRPHLTDRGFSDQEINSYFKGYDPVSMVLVFLSQFEGKGTIGWPHTNNCGSQLSAFRDDIQSYKAQLKDDDPLLQPLIGLETQLNHTITANQKKDRTFHARSGYQTKFYGNTTNLAARTIRAVCLGKLFDVFFDISPISIKFLTAGTAQGRQKGPKGRTVEMPRGIL